MRDIEALLTGYDNSLVRQGAVSDYVSERWDVRSVPVSPHEMPKGFHRRFVRRSVPRLRRLRAEMPRGPLNSCDIWYILTNWLAHREDDPFDHGGGSSVLGLPVVVGEPYFAQGRDAATTDGPVRAARLADMLGFPVTFHHGGAWYDSAPSLCRYCVWFTFDSPEPGAAHGAT